MAGIQRQPTRRDQYKLTGVQVLNDRVLGYGPYSADIELEYVGLKCIGKKLHQALFMQGETTAKVRQLKEQCNILSQISHPNVAMFLGLFFQQSPILVVEYIPYSLAFCIEQYGVLPNEVSYSILRDVALGLSYLHNHNPAIIHGELTSSSVLLTPDMTAKISYQGEAKILRLTQADISNVATKCGTSVYMAPEFTTNAGQAFHPSMDIYSYGIVMIHTISCKQPNAVATTESTSISLVIAEHMKHSEMVDRNHPLMKLILSCTNTNPQNRPHTDEVVKNLREVVAKLPSSFTHRLEMLRHIHTDQQRQLLEKDGASLQDKIQQNKQRLVAQGQELKKLMTEKERLRVKLIRDSELADRTVEELRELQIQGSS